MIKRIKSTYKLTELFRDTRVQGKLCIKFKVLEQIIIETCLFKRIRFAFFDFIVQAMEFFSIFWRIVFGAYIINLVKEIEAGPSGIWPTSERRRSKNNALSRDDRFWR